MLHCFKTCNWGSRYPLKVSHFPPSATVPNPCYKTYLWSAGNCFQTKSYCSFPLLTNTKNKTGIFNETTLWTNNLCYRSVGKRENFTSSDHLISPQIFLFIFRATLWYDNACKGDNVRFICNFSFEDLARAKALGCLIGGYSDPIKTQETIHKTQ